MVARVDDLSELGKALAEIANQRIGGAGLLAWQPALFAEPALGVHFARMVVIPSESDGRFADWFVFESNFDTEEAAELPARERHLELLAAHATDTLTSAFSCCEGFPKKPDAAALGTALKKSLVPATASYQGHTERDLGRIQLEKRVREVVMTFLERAPQASQAALYKQVRDHVRAQCKTDPTLSGLNIDAPAPALPSAALRHERLKHPVEPWVMNAKPALPLLGDIPKVLAWEREDTEFDLRARQEAWTASDRKQFSDIAATEDHGVQNALTHVVPLRAGAGRQQVLVTAHAYIDRLAKAYFDDIGQLGGIPSIHFAKWLLLDAGQRLLFFSNYDSSWESYLGDFVDQAALGLNLAWSCTEDYPRTHLLAFGGAKDEERFKSWGRAHQRPTQVFYSAYPDLSIAALNNNTWIRHGLHERPSATDIKAWFRRLT